MVTNMNIQGTVVEHDEFLNAKVNGVKAQLPFITYESYVYKGCFYISGRDTQGLWRYTKSKYSEYWDNNKHTNFWTQTKH